MKITSMITISLLLELSVAYPVSALTMAECEKITSQDRVNFEKCQKLILAQQDKEEKQQQSLIQKYHATDLSGDFGLKANSLVSNPFAYTGKYVFISLMYKQNISPTAAILIGPSRSFLQLNTKTDYSGSPLVSCIVKVLGVTKIKRDNSSVEIPNLQEVECITR